MIILLISYDISYSLLRLLYFIKLYQEDIIHDLHVLLQLVVSDPEAQLKQQFLLVIINLIIKFLNFVIHNLQRFICIFNFETHLR
jgi:hypothetical protein